MVNASKIIFTIYDDKGSPLNNVQVFLKTTEWSYKGSTGASNTFTETWFGYVGKTVEYKFTRQDYQDAFKSVQVPAEGVTNTVKITMVVQGLPPPHDPTVKITNPANGATVKGVIRLSFSGQNVAYYKARFEWAGELIFETPPSMSTSFDFDTMLLNRNGDIRLQVLAGASPNIWEASDSILIKVDNTVLPPGLPKGSITALDAPKDAISGEDVTISYRVKNTGSYGFLQVVEKWADEPEVPNLLYFDEGEEIPFSKTKNMPNAAASFDLWVKAYPGGETHAHKTAKVSITGTNGGLIPSGNWWLYAILIGGGLVILYMLTAPKKATRTGRPAPTQTKENPGNPTNPKRELDIVMKEDGKYHYVGAIHEEELHRRNSKGFNTYQGALSAMKKYGYKKYESGG